MKILTNLPFRSWPSKVPEFWGARRSFFSSSTTCCYYQGTPWMGATLEDTTCMMVPCVFHWRPYFEAKVIVGIKHPNCRSVWCMIGRIISSNWDDCARVFEKTVSSSCLWKVHWSICYTTIRKYNFCSLQSNIWSPASYRENCGDKPSEILISFKKQFNWVKTSCELPVIHILSSAKEWWMTTEALAVLGVVMFADRIHLWSLKPME